MSADIKTPHQRASAIVGGVWAGRSDYAGLYASHVASEERAILAEERLIAVEAWFDTMFGSEDAEKLRALFRGVLHRVATKEPTNV